MLLILALVIHALDFWLTKPESNRLYLLAHDIFGESLWRIVLKVILVLLAAMLFAGGVPLFVVELGCIALGGWTLWKGYHG